MGKEGKQFKNKTKIKTGTLNLQGAWDTGPSGIGGGKLDAITRFMDNTNLDVLALQETKRPSNDVIKKIGYIFVFASSIVSTKANTIVDTNYQFRADEGRTKQKVIGNSRLKAKEKEVVKVRATAKVREQIRMKQIQKRSGME